MHRSVCCDTNFVHTITNIVVCQIRACIFNRVKIHTNILVILIHLCRRNILPLIINYINISFRKNLVCFCRILLSYFVLLNNKIHLAVNQVDYENNLFVYYRFILLGCIMVGLRMASESRNILFANYTVVSIHRTITDLC